MLTCIACPKLNTAGSLREPTEDDENGATPSTKQAIKALTSQIKDIAVKASGACKTCKSCSCSSRQNRGGDYLDSDAASVSERFFGPYRRTGTSTPKKEMGTAKLKAFSSGSSTPASISGRTESILFMEEDEPKEWVAQVEPGVLITFVSMPKGGNDLKRIRFSREVFNKWQAQQWWAENHDRVMELYNVQRFNHPAVPLPTPPHSEGENSKLESTEDCATTPPLNTEHWNHGSCCPTGIGDSSLDSIKRHPLQPCHHHCSVGLSSTSEPSYANAAKAEASFVDGSARSSSSSRGIDHSGELSVSNASDGESEWVEQDEPGVYITIRSLPSGARELRRVRFSRERFGEMQARSWWDENKARIQQQYL
ncbi:protein Brevis radix-like 2 [Andrographis paniculata]|uniref:protein Brevis radix-like 2 n=1 Tax=Andrographis paniculata TaxID=175694 RepID=UPI0021E7A9C4|nr:protein Brevis radix-like 2 [Andrographis paniculata]XP_051147915.1 protein Brevis radix-like 2 [Andrographis paniculata]